MISSASNSSRLRSTQLQRRFAERVSGGDTCFILYFYAGRGKFIPCRPVGNCEEIQSFPAASGEGPHALANGKARAATMGARPARPATEPWITDATVGRDPTRISDAAAGGRSRWHVGQDRPAGAVVLRPAGGAANP